MIIKQRAGFFGAILILGIVSLGISFTKPYVSLVDAEEKSLLTSDDLQSLRRGIFDYVRTMGSLPPQLDDLWVKGSQPDIAFDSEHGIGAGWIGPYVTDDIIEHLDQRNKDRFGRPLKYVTTAEAVHVQSAGADGVFGNADDLSTDVAAEELFSDITGRIMSRGRPAPSVLVTMHVPRAGVPFEFKTQTDQSGAYAFSRVPLGVRSITVADASKKLRWLVTFDVQREAATVPDIVLKGPAE